MFSVGGIYLYDTFRWMATRTPGSQRIHHGLQRARKSLGDYFQRLSPQGKPTSLQKILSWTRGQFQEVLTWWQSVPWKKWISSSEAISTEPLSTRSDTVNHQPVQPAGERSPLVRTDSNEIQAVKQASEKIAPLPETAIRPKKDVKTSWQKILGSDPSGIEFRQRAKTSTCYVLSPLGAILQHPQALEILERIPVYKVQQDGESGFRVHFSGQETPVFIPDTALGQGVHSDCPGIQLLEQAYLRLEGAQPLGQWDESAQALCRMFGQENPEMISIQNSRDISTLPLVEHDKTKVWKEVTVGKFTFSEEFPRDPDHYIGEQGFIHEERVQKFEDYLEQAHREKENPQSLDILTAIQHGGGHYYAVLPHESYYDRKAEEWMVTLADPFDFQPDAFFTVPLSEFMTDFNIEGIRLARKPVATNPFKTAP
jgi:hypothetical protein